MPRTMSVLLAASAFLSETREILQSVSRSRAVAVRSGLGGSFEKSFYDYGIIRLHAAFESFVLKALVGVINQRPNALTGKTGVSFPLNMWKAACEFLVTGGGYFDIRGRDGLIRTLKQLLLDDHYLVEIAADQDYREAIERLWALRDLAAHKSACSKAAALRAVQAKNMPSAGA